MPENTSDLKTDFLHPSFRSKTVYHLDCVYCFTNLCIRGMKAILLADTATEMFSTDTPIRLSVDTVGDGYCTSHCSCKVKDVACLQCGNIVGYHVCLPCRQCMLSCNNGHFWMFYSDAIYPSERLNQTGNEIQTWGTLPTAKEELFPGITYIEECLR